MRSPLVALLALVLVAACEGSIPPDVDVCEPSCDDNATCAGASCSCNTGWEGDGIACSDVDECITDNGGCDSNATCSNLPGGRNCGCNAPFVGDGLTCFRMWVPRASAQLRLSNVATGLTNDAVATAVGERIYFAPDTRIGLSADHYFRYFDIQTMTFSDPLELPHPFDDDFCACGYTQVFVGAGTDVFSFGNHSMRYDTQTNKWWRLTNWPSYEQVRRGESAGAFEASNGTIYMIGGRGLLETALRFQVPDGSFVVDSGNLPFGLEGAVAWAPAGNNVVYVAGGNASDNNRRHLLSRATGVGGWNAHPDAPIELGDPTGMGDWQGKLWVTTRTQMVFYDLTANMWLSPIALPEGFVTAVSVGLRTFAFVQNGEQLEVQELIAIE